MPTNPFIILGISRDASQNEIYEAYKAKRDYYKEHIFDEGESGAQAARMLEQVEQAYKQAMDMSHDNATVSGEGESSRQSTTRVRSALSRSWIRFLIAARSGTIFSR